jgi:hypothetical protein
MNPSALALTLTVLLAIGLNAVGQPTPTTARSPTELTPSGFVVAEEIRGDLNKDNQTDYVYIVKGTDKSKFFQHEYRGQLDRNRRGIVVVLKSQDQYELATANLDCFSSENEDGGVYYAPELSISINGGILSLHYAHGRYGYWAYKFRYQNGDFALIGYDASQNRGPVTQRAVSINLMTKKMQIRENVNQDAEQTGDERFKETWRPFALLKPITLRKIESFDEFDLERLLMQAK